MVGDIEPICPHYNFYPPAHYLFWWKEECEDYKLMAESLPYKDEMVEEFKEVLESLLPDIEI
jgi:hypothetical protein